MQNTASILLHQGGKDQLLADFTALGETTTSDGLLKYSPQPTLQWLAKFITAQGGGPHKDVALYELSHLVYGVANLLGEQSLTEFFLSPHRASPAFYRQHFQDIQSTSSVEITSTHLRLTYDKKHFDLRFGRMPMLACLYDFLCSMDNFSYFTDFNNLFFDLVKQPLSDTALRSCANGLASRLRKYRIQNLTTAEADGKFIQVYKFLQNKTDENHIIIEDDDILNFWSLHNNAKDYRGYRTVFDLFCDFTKAFEEANALRNAAHAAPLGLDMEQGEVDISEQDIVLDTQDDWQSPLNIFDEEALKNIRFFKKSSERAPIEALMKYGPDALRLPMAFLRHDVFGQVQAGITNDLQVGRGRASVEKRITCENTPPYGERLFICEKILTHVAALQAASLHVLSQQNPDILHFDNPVKTTVKTAFAKVKRKGFEEDTLNDEATQAAFSQAAGGLVRISDLLEKYISLLKQRDLDNHFSKDCTAFKIQFTHLYEGAFK